MKSLAALFDELTAAKTAQDVRAILNALGDFPKEATLGEVFGGQFAWLPFGARTTNVSTIELATHPGRSVVERVNNSVDALIDAAIRTAAPKETPKSPFEAAQLCFNRPAKDDQLVAWFDSHGTDEEAQRLSVVILEGASRDEPRVDIVDSGSGILPTLFPSTILSLNVENKIKVHYALGLFGQGGASSLAFCNCALIASRSTEKTGLVGFTVVRRCELKGWKESCYAYLATMDKKDGLHIPTFMIGGSSTMNVYTPTGEHAIDAKLPKLAHGTLIRHFDYKLQGMSNALSSSQKNVYHSLHYLLFDPLIPYRLTDLRPGQIDTRHVAGSRNRLMKLVLKAKEKTADGRMELKYHRPLEFVAPPGSSDPCIGYECWVVFSWRKLKDGDHELRSGTEQFADRDHPILVTYNGQNHGELTGDALKKVGLNLLSRHMVVNIDASRASADVKRELFTSTREALRKSATLQAIIERIQESLAEDSRLFALEKELTDRALAGATKSASANVKRDVIRMLRESGLQVGTRLGLGGTVGAARATPRRRRTRKAPAVADIGFPQCYTLRNCRPSRRNPSAAW